jgi:hypothetical protein
VYETRLALKARKNRSDLSLRRFWMLISRITLGPEQRRLTRFQR